MMHYRHNHDTLPTCHCEPHTRRNGLVIVFRPASAFLSGRKQPKKAQMAVISPVKAPQATRDLGMARADRSAAWLPREHAEARSMTPRSVSARVPPFPSWKWPSPPFRSRPPSVPLEYRGSNARYDQSQCFIITTTRHSLTLPTGNPRSFYPRSLELTKNKSRASTRRRFPSW